MKTLKIIFQSDKSNNEETKKNEKTGTLLKSIIVIFMLSWLILLSSCALFISVPGGSRHEGNNEHHGHK